MEHISHETTPTYATPQAAYEQNHIALLELMGRINARLSANYRSERPRGWEHIGQQEEMIAMLQSVADYLDA
jgi:hypothetical protein